MWFIVLRFCNMYLLSQTVVRFETKAFERCETKAVERCETKAVERFESF